MRGNSKTSEAVVCHTMRSVLRFSGCRQAQSANVVEVHASFSTGVSADVVQSH